MNSFRPDIVHFRGQYAFLSNFFDLSAYNFEFAGFPCRTSEHAYQIEKTLDEAWRTKIRACETPGQAKRLGQKAPKRVEWDALKILTMEKILVAKFRIFDLREMLLSTGDAVLIEGNDWGDTFWGVSGGVGENNLGKLLMKVRDKYKYET